MRTIIAICLLLAGCASVPPMPVQEIAKTCETKRGEWEDGFEWFVAMTPARGEIRWIVVEPAVAVGHCQRGAIIGIVATTHACFKRTPDLGCEIVIASTATREQVCHEVRHCRGWSHR